MITEHTDIYFTNSQGHRFPTRELAELDEKKRIAREWVIDRVVGSYYEFESAPAFIAIDDTKYPYTSQPDGTAKVYLFKDLVAHMQRCIAQHGDMVGFTNHHVGMGRDSREMVVIRRNINSPS